MYKAFSKKVDALDAQMVKLKADMEAETAKLSVTRAQLYIGSIERLRNTLEKDLSKAARDIKQVHGTLNHTELDKLHAYDIDLQQKLQLVTNQLTRLSLPAIINPIKTTIIHISRVGLRNMGDGRESGRRRSSPNDGGGHAQGDQQVHPEVH